MWSTLHNVMNYRIQQRPQLGFSTALLQMAVAYSKSYSQLVPWCYRDPSAALHHIGMASDHSMMGRVPRVELSLARREVAWAHA